jgi:hypothetical protein
MGGPRQGVDQRGIARITAVLDCLYRQASARPRSTLPNFRSMPPRRIWLSQPVDFLSALHIRLSWSCRPSASNAFSEGMFHAAMGLPVPCTLLRLPRGACVAATRRPRRCPTPRCCSCSCPNQSREPRFPLPIPPNRMPEDIMSQGAEEGLAIP